MASKPRRIAAVEWDGHKDNILNLRQSGVSINGENGIVARMERDFGFAATSAQYELQLSKWGARKNISADEWRRTLQVVDQYNEDGMKCAVYKNGELVRPSILRKKRNQHCKGQEYARFRQNRVSSAILPECIQIKITESQFGGAGMIDVGEEYGRSPGSRRQTSAPYNLGMAMRGITPVATSSHVGAVGGFGIGESYISTYMQAPSPFLEQPNQIMGAMSTLANKDQGFENSFTYSTSELLADALPLDMDLYTPTNNCSIPSIVSDVGGYPAPRKASLESWLIDVSQSPSSADFPEAQANGSVRAGVPTPQDDGIQPTSARVC